ncbi:MAG: hypothetical protein DRR08_15700 [Candidatus Parabeggiatoa sp. nov. 2]|nr:MAG: hypothetical protein DRR08_15700 [Gammaproteobacteria bacterium]
MAQNRRVLNVIFINNLPRIQPIKRSAPKTFNAIKSSVWVLGRTLKNAPTASEYEGKTYALTKEIYLIFS